MASRNMASPATVSHSTGGRPSTASHYSSPMGSRRIAIPSSTPISRARRLPASRGPMRGNWVRVADSSSLVELVTALRWVGIQSRRRLRGARVPASRLRGLKRPERLGQAPLRMKALLRARSTYHGTAFQFAAAWLIARVSVRPEF